MKKLIITILFSLTTILLNAQEYEKFQDPNTLKYGIRNTNSKEVIVKPILNEIIGSALF